MLGSWRDAWAGFILSGPNWDWVQAYYGLGLSQFLAPVTEKKLTNLELGLKDAEKTQKRVFLSVSWENNEFAAFYRINTAYWFPATETFLCFTFRLECKINPIPDPAQTLVTLISSDDQNQLTLIL